MAYDFRANQIRLNRIISSGSIPIYIYPSSSAADFAGNLVPSFSTAGIGTDVFLFVSGSSTAKTLFGGDVVVSGSLTNGQDLTITGLYSHAEGLGNTAGGDYSHVEGINTDANGNYSHAEGRETLAAGEGSHAAGRETQANGDYSHTIGTGSIAAGNYSFAAGNKTEAFADYQTAVGKFNVTSNSASLFVVGDGLDASNRHDILRVNSGSVQVTGSLFVTQTMSASIVSASYIRANGINITPVVAQLTIGGDNTNRASGSISGLFESGSLMTPGTIGKFDVEVLAMDYNFETGASWKYTVTALWPYSGNFTVLASTEIAVEYGPTAGSYNPTNDWDVNFNNLGQIELTGSAPAFLMGGTSFYVQVTKKMISGYSSIIA